MESGKKFRYIVLPFLATAIGFSVLYTFSVWLLVTGSNLIVLKESVYRLWLPLFLSLPVVYGVLIPRFRKLKKAGESSLRVTLLFVLAVIATAAPTVFMQEYARVSSEKLTQLKNIKAISFNEPTKYYTVRSYYPDKNHNGLTFSFEEAGQLGELIRFNVYVTTPMVPVSADTLSGECPAWICMKYEKLVSKTLSEAEKSKIFDQFMGECRADYRKTDYRDIQYFRRVEKGDDTKRFTDALKKDRFYRSGNENILIPVFEPYREKRGSLMLWMFISFGLAAALLVFMVKKDGISTGPSVESEEDESIADLLTPGRNFMFTPFIALINVALFIIMAFSLDGFIRFKPEDLVAWGANYQPFVTNGEWWRLVSCIFINKGLTDLLVSLYGLVFIGLLLEPRIGKVNFLIVFLVSGIIGNCLYDFFDSNVVAGGMSVSISGLYGVFIALLATKSFHSKVRNEILLSMFVFTSYSILDIINTGIFNPAMLGGLFCGLLLGLTMLQTAGENEQRRKLPVLLYVMACWLMLMSVGIMTFKHNPARRYRSLVKEFTRIEARAIEECNHPGTTEDQKVKTFTGAALNDWQECRKIADRMEEIKNLPPALAAKRELMKKYCDYRIEICKLTARNIESHFMMDTRMLDQYNEKIALIIKKINGVDIPDSQLEITPILQQQPGVLYVVNGKPVEDAGNINPDKIKSLEVLKPDMAMKIYGKRGENGAILITE